MNIKKSKVRLSIMFPCMYRHRKEFQEKGNSEYTMSLQTLRTHREEKMKENMEIKQLIEAERE